MNMIKSENGLDSLLPWMARQEIALIEKYLFPSAIMLEWGSGFSTHYFSQFVKGYYSIEHEREWYDKISQLQHIQPINSRAFQERTNKDGCFLFYVPPNKHVPPPESNYISHKDYIEQGGIIGNMVGGFDIVLIDGRSRVACSRYIVPWLNKRAVILFHDFWKSTRGRYREILDIYTEIESIRDTEQTISILKLKDSRAKGY